MVIRFLRRATIATQSIFGPAFDPLDIGLNSALSLLELRDVTLARAEDEVSREIALRVPVSDKTLKHLEMATRAHENDQYVETRWPQPRHIVPVSTLDTAEAPVNRRLRLNAVDP
jgi:hypothetical protein